MRDQRIQTLVEIALCIALSVVLNFIAIRLPVSIAGGSISLTMLPIAVLALRRGLLAGAAAGLFFGLLDLLMEPFILVPAQVILDYPAPYLLFGLGVGLFVGLYRRSLQQPKWGKRKDASASLGAPSLSTSSGASSTAGIDFQASAITDEAPALNLNLHKRSAIIIVAFLVGGLLRYCCHVLSGVLFFAEYAGGGNVWIYSLVYNISYLGPSLALSAILALILSPILDKAVPVLRKRPALYHN
jgi:thiamine transporter